MFVVKPTKILLFSSECKTSPASNLLAGNGFSKWKCEKPGTKQAVVELLLPEPTRITQLDIGNEASAFVEILVKRQAEDAEFQVLLPTSSFLSPVEAKEHKNFNRVRLFGEDKFISTVAQSKWDTVRVVCTQPFVNDVQYGLAFLRIYTNHDPNASGAPQPESSTGTKRTSQATTMALDGDNEEDDDIKAGSLFAKKKQRLNGDEEENGNTVSKPSTSSSTSNVKAQIRDASDRAMAAAPSRAISSSSSQASSARGASPKPVTTIASSSAAAKSPSHEAEVPLKELMKGVVLVLSGYKNPMRGQLRDKAIKMGAKYRPDWSDKECTHLICAFPGTPKFEEVKGKGFIVSDKWILDSFSAKRLQPWRKYRVGRAPSPPASVGRKFNQEANTSRRAAATNAKSKLAVSDDDDDGSEMSDDTPANRRKRRKPKKKATSSTDEDGEAASDDGDWKPSKRMNRNASPSSSSSAESNASLDAEDLEDTDLDDDEDKKKKPARAAKLSKKPSAAKRETKKPESPVVKKVKPSVEEKEEKVTRTPEKAKPVAVAKKSPAKKVADSDSDDDGGWSVVRRKGPGSSSASSSPVKSLTTTPKKRQETVEESKPSASGTVPELPDFLAGKHFLLFGDFPDSERRILKRIIVAFGGHLEEYMGDKVTTVVTKERWSRHFDEALAANDKLVFMKPDWLFACDKAAKLVPWQQYSISKA